MMIREWGRQVNVRVPIGLVQRMDRLVRTKNYRNRADIVLIALRQSVPDLESELNRNPSAEKRRATKPTKARSARIRKR